MWMHVGLSELATINVICEDDSVRVDRSVRFYGPGPFFIGKNTRIDAFTVITSSGRPVSIGRNVHIAVGVYLQGSHGLTLADATFIAAGARVFTGSEDYRSSPLIGPSIGTDFKMLTTAPVTFEAGSGLGANTIVLPGVTIGRGATVGALSMVNRNVPPYTLVAGVPATFRAYRPKDAIEAALADLERKNAP